MEVRRERDARPAATEGGGEVVADLVEAAAFGVGEALPETR